MIARQLMQDKGAIFVVGDDAQSIYSFRGANLDNILELREDLPQRPHLPSSSATTALRRPSSRLRGRSSRTTSTRSPRMSSRRSLSVSLSPCMRRSRVTSKPLGLRRSAASASQWSSLQLGSHPLPYQCAEPYPRAGLPPCRAPLPYLWRTLVLRPQGDHGRRRLLPRLGQRAG